MSNDSRAEFEKWYAVEDGVDTSHKIFNKTADGSYLYMRTRMDHQIWQARDAEVAELRAEKQMISNMLAIMHSDGGHFEAANGTAMAIGEAINKFYRILNENDQLKGLI